MKIKNCKLKIFQEKGFTIAELLVAMGIFVILIGIIVGIFIGGFRTQRSIVGLIAANDNAGLAIEQMTREMRTGTKFCIVDSALGCVSTLYQGSTIQFTNVEENEIEYALQGNSITRQENSGLPQRITGNTAQISNLLFTLVHVAPSDPPWPSRITISLSVNSTELNLREISTNIQTTVSGRNF